MPEMKKFDSVDEYIASHPAEVQTRLKSIRQAIKEETPAETQETTSWGMPTYKLDNKNLVHFAAFKDHISLFPGNEAVVAFTDKLSDYKTSKGTIQFPLVKPLPLALVRNIIKWCVKARRGK